MSSGPDRSPLSKDAKGRFITGNIGGGRPRGARSKLGEKFLEDILSAWEERGADAIQVVLRDRPQDFLRVVASILPKEVNGDVAHRIVRASDLGDDELLAIALGQT